MSLIENEQSNILYLLGCLWGTPSYDFGFSSSPQKNLQPGGGGGEEFRTIFPCRNIFLLPSPGNPEGGANQEGYLRRSKRFDHITDHQKESLIKKISFVTVRIISHLIILALENLIIEMLTLPTNPHAIQGRSTLKDKSERQFWNGPFRELKERIYYEVHEQSMGTIYEQLTTQRLKN